MYTITRGGYNAKHPKEFFMSRPNGLDCYLILIVRSPAYFKIGEDTFTIKTHSAIMIRPHVPYQYSGLDGEYKNDWLYFTCSDTEFDAKYSQLINRPISLNNSLQLSQYFQHIVWENSYSPERFRRQNVSMLFQIVLNKLVQEAQTTNTREAYHPYASKLQELRLTMLSRPNKNFSATELAAMLNVSPSYFQFLYKSFFGLPFKSDLINMRLDYARDLILETNLPLEQIAQMSGYTNEIHFYRQFKAKTGMTPREYQVSMKE